jgi:integrase
VRRFKDKRLYDRGGRYIWTRVRDERGYIVRVSTRTADEKAATLFSDEWERRAADPGYRRASDATFGSAMTDWLAELTRRGVSAATYNIAEIKLGHFVRLWGESWPLLRITNDLVLQFIDRRMTEPGATRDSTVKPLTVKKELAALKQMLEWAKFRGTFPVDIATVIPPGFSGRHRPRTRAPSREEVVALLQNLEPHRAAHVAFIVATGARRAESFRACREDVDPKGLTIRIRGSKTERANDRVPITGLTRDFVLFAIQKAPSDVPLFAPWGKMNRDIAAACVRAGIDRVSPNDLRRAFGKWHRLAGATAEQVGLLLRHTTDTLAQTTYAKVSAADIGEALREMPGMSVPDLYAGDAQTAPYDPNTSAPNTGKQASPTRFELVTPGLGNQSTEDGPSPRSVGNKLAHAKRRKAHIVPELDGGRPTYFAWLSWGAA